MSLNFSTGLKNGMLDSTGFKSAFTNGTLWLFSGPQPTDADSAVSGTPLAKITLASGAFSFGSGTNGINFGTPVANVVSKAAAEVWSGVGIAAGTVGWFRLMGNPSDNLGSSTTLKRVDGSVGVSGADLNLPNTTVAVGTPVTIDVFQITLP